MTCLLFTPVKTIFHSKNMQDNPIFNSCRTEFIVKKNICICSRFLILRERRVFKSFLAKHKGIVLHRQYYDCWWTGGASYEHNKITHLTQIHMVASALKTVDYNPSWEVYYCVNDYILTIISFLGLKIRIQAQTDGWPQISNMWNINPKTETSNFVLHGEMRSMLNSPHMACHYL